MNYEFLKRLFTSCSDESGGSYADGLNQNELYGRIEETAEAEREFREACKKAGLDSATEDRIGDAAYGMTWAYEMQGFINGFRFCAQLGREISGTEDSPINLDKYMAAIQRLVGLASPRQIRFLEARGFQHVGQWQFETAKHMIDRIAANGWRIPPEIIPEEYQPRGVTA